MDVILFGFMLFYLLAINDENPDTNDRLNGRLNEHSIIWQTEKNKILSRTTLEPFCKIFCLFLYGP